MDYLKNINIGLDKENIITIPLPMSNLNNSNVHKELKIRLENVSSIISVTGSFTHPLNMGTPPTSDINYKGTIVNKKVPVNMSSVGFGFEETFNIQMIDGKSLNYYSGNERGKIVVNESFRDLLGKDNIIGEKIKIGGNFEGEIVGVMKNFNFESVTENKVEPLLLFNHPGVNYIFVKYQPNNLSSILEIIKSEWKEINPNYPFQYEIFSEEYNNIFNNSENLGRILLYFTLIAGLIACVGLIGLSSFSVEKRVKEIGIRKVLGSSMQSMLKLLFKEYLQIFLYSALFSIPIQN